MKRRVAEQKMQRGIPHRARQETDRRLNRWHLFLLFQRHKPLCCQRDEKALFAPSFVVALVSLFVSLTYFLFFSSLPLFARGHVLSNSSCLKCSDAFRGRSAKFPFKVRFSFFYPFVYFSVFALGFPASLHHPWTHWSVLLRVSSQPLGIVIIFYPSCLSRDW